MAGKFKLIFGNLLKSLHQLWLEVTGAFLLVFAAAFGYYAFKEYRKFPETTENIWGIVCGCRFVSADAGFWHPFLLEVQETSLSECQQVQVSRGSRTCGSVPWGRRQAWEALILRYRRLIYSIPVKFSFTTADASDVFQAVCLKLIEHLHELEG